VQEVIKLKNKITKKGDNMARRIIETKASRERRGLGDVMEKPTPGKRDKLLGECREDISEVEIRLENLLSFKEIEERLRKTSGMTKLKADTNIRTKLELELVRLIADEARLRGFDKIEGTPIDKWKEKENDVINKKAEQIKKLIDGKTKEVARNRKKQLDRETYNRELLREAHDNGVKRNKK